MAIFSKSFIFTLIFSFGFFITYNQVFNSFPSDILAHITDAQSFAPGHVVKIVYPMWHIVVYNISDFFNMRIEQSAVIVTALIIVALAMVIFSIVKFSLQHELSHFSENQQEHLFLGMTVILMIMTAIYAPFFNKNLYVGQASCGVWHNVTLLIVKPFALFSVYLTVLYFETKQRKWLITSTLVILLSIYAKPSFIIVFLPAIFIFFALFVMQRTGLNILQIFLQIPNILKRFQQEVIFLITVSLLSVLILWDQYTSVYAATSTSTIVFDFLGVWSLNTPNIPISILLTYLFPIAVLFLVNKKENNTYLLAWIMTIISVLFFACFAEEGPRYQHGNFGWSQQISVQILFVMSLIVFVKNYTRLKNWKIYILSIILSLHIVSGIFYLAKVAMGGHYV